MPLPYEIKNYLKKGHAIYWHKTHPVAYTAQEIAAVEHVPGRELAKTVVLKADNELILAVLPANRVVNMEALKRHIGCRRLELAAESEFKGRFGSSQTGAMPPFGGLFNVPVFCDNSIAADREIEFNAGTHVDTIRMTFTEFVRLERPEFANFSLDAAKSFAARAA
jgi:Ala-tRNA(Pro) deacylase